MAASLQQQVREIKAGDSLYSLAEELLGDQKYWRELSLFNQTDIFAPLEAGMKIKIPTAKQAQEILSGAIASLPKVASEVLASQLESLDLSGIKQPETAPYTLIDWVI